MTSVLPNGRGVARRHLLRHVAIEHRLDELVRFLAQCAGVKSFLHDAPDFQFAAFIRFDQAAESLPDLGEHLNFVLFAGKPVVEAAELVSEGRAQVV